MSAERSQLFERARSLVRRLADGGRDDAARDALLRDIAAWQAERVPAFGRLLAARGADPRRATRVDSIPALPTDVFRYARIAAHDPEHDRRVFRTSGTSSTSRGTHAFRDLVLYDTAARAAARYALFPDVERIRLVVLAPHERQAPASSLSYMLSRFDEWFGDGETAWVWRDDALCIDALRDALHRAQRQRAPVALLGTSFAFVHADDALGDVRLSLPEGSRVMQTGGFKGRSRSVAPEAMRAMLSSRYGVAEAFVVAEYGMTELSSQLYETSLRETLRATGGARRLWVPGWVRATAVHPETLKPVAAGETGILRIDDVANVDSACCIQTADLARHLEGGIEVLGRAEGATPRGCSLAADEALEAS